MAAPQKGEGEDWGEIPAFRTLRRLITLLTATLIIGIMTIAGVLIWRIAAEPTTPPVAAIGAEAVTLPSDAEIVAVGAGPSGLAIAIRRGGRQSLLVFHPETGARLSETEIRREE